MRDFIYNTSQGLHISDCDWLSKMGLVETQWFLDTRWLVNRITYSEWIN